MHNIMLDYLYYTTISLLISIVFCMFIVLPSCFLQCVSLEVNRKQVEVIRPHETAPSGAEWMLFLNVCFVHD